MAVPTITSIDPAAGPTKGGNLVMVNGTNFRLPPAPTALGYVGGGQPRTVKLTVGGVESDWAYVANATLIYAQIPEWRGSYKLTFPVDLDVRVANLDDNEDEIAGENVTKVDGYQITRPDLTGETYFQRVCRELIMLFRRHVLENTHLTVKRDYDEDPTDAQRLRASLPVVHLIGPRTPLNRFDSINREEAVVDPSDPDAFLRKRVPVTVDVNFDVLVWADNSKHLMSLQQAILLFFRDVTELRVERDPADPALGSVEYGLSMPFDGYPDFNTGASLSDLNSFRARCMIKGVHIDDESATVIERGWKIMANDGEPTLDMQSL